MSVFIRYSLPLIALLLLVSCGGQTTGTPTPVVKATVTPIPSGGTVFPTPVPVPELLTILTYPPTATAGGPTPANETPTAVAAQVTEDSTVVPSAWESSPEFQYAEACGRIMTVDLNGMSVAEYVEWVQSFADLTPPTDLADYHHAVLNIYRSKAKPSLDELDTRAPYINFALAFLYLDENTLRLLRDEHCLTRVEVEISRVVADTRDRLFGSERPNAPMTVEQFALGCADIRLSAPWGMDIPVIGTYLLHHWVNLHPPDHMGGYHEAMRLFYEEWVAKGDPDYDSPVARASVSAGQALPLRTVELLVRAGCLGD